MITPEAPKGQTKQEVCISASEKLHSTSELNLFFQSSVLKRESQVCAFPATAGIEDENVVDRCGKMLPAANTNFTSQNTLTYT